MVRVRPLVLATRLALRLQTAVQYVPPQPTVVVISRLNFVLVWVVLLGFHIVCAALYAVWAYVHLVMSFNSEASAISYIGLIDSATAFTAAGWAFAFCSVTHVLAVTRVLYTSLKRGELVLTDTHASSRPWCLGNHPLKRWLWDPYVGFKKRFPDEIFALQEALQIVLLSVRAFGLARWQQRSWLLRAYVVLVVLNCWSSPVIQWLQRRAKTRRRLLCYAFDMVSDLASTLLLPAAMAWPQLPLFNPTFVWYRGSDATEEMSRYQLRIFEGVAQSWFDVFHIIVFSVFLYTRVVGIRSSIQRRDDCGNAVTVFSVISTQSMRSIPCKPPPAKPYRGLDALIRMIHAVGTAWGGIILVVHCISETRPTYAWCTAQTSPWFTVAARCEAVDLDCAASQIQGRRPEMERVFAALLPREVLTLSITNCPTLEIPPAIQKLRNLEKLYIQNSTLVDWGPSAAILDRFQPEVRSISMSSTQMLNGVPEGLCCTGDLPLLLSSLALESSNLSSLPERLDSVWHDPFQLILDNNAFITVPPVATRLALLFLSMTANKLTTVPAELLTYHGTFSEIQISKNPIRALTDPLPSYPQGNQHLPYLRLDDTAITQLPSWIWRAQGVSAVGAPFCQAYTGVLPSQRTQWLEDHGHDATVAYLVNGLIECEIPQ